MLTDVSDANKSYTKLVITQKDDLDLTALRVLRRDRPEFLFPLKMMEIDGEAEIRYELTDGVRFSYLPNQMHKRELIELFTNMILPFKTCSDWFLDYHNFVLDENYIFVGKNEQSISYVYIPTRSQRNSDDEIMNFFAGLILKMDVKDDQSFTVNLLRVVKEKNANLMTLLEYLQKEYVERKVIAAEPVKPAEDPMKKIVSFVQDIPEKVVEKKEKQDVRKTEKQKNDREQGIRPGNSSYEYGKNDEENRLINSLFGDDEPDKKKAGNKKEQKKEKAPKEKGAGIFGFLKGKKKNEGSDNILANSQKTTAIHEMEYVPKWKPESEKPEEKVEQYRSYMQEEDCEDNTAIDADGTIDDNRTLRLRLEDCAGCTCPKFIEIDLTKGHATIGRMDKNGEPCSDYNFDAAVSFVSRRHFRIEPSGDEWQIIDIGSSNGTIVSGENLVPNIPHRLKRNDTIMIVCKKRFMIYRVC